MPTELKIEETESALIAATQAVFGGTVEVHGMSGLDIDANGNIIAAIPAVLVRYEKTVDKEKGLLGLDYASTHSFLLICGATNLRSPGEQIAAALQLVSQARSGLAGLRLTLDDGAVTTPIALAGTEKFQWTTDASWYAATVVVGGTAQFAPK